MASTMLHYVIASIKANKMNMDNVGQEFTTKDLYVDKKVLKEVFYMKKKSLITENLNSLKLKRRKISSGYKGYSFRTTIYLDNGEEADGWNNFIINSSDTVRKDPFFFDVIGGSIDYDYIERLFEEQQ